MKLFLPILILILFLLTTNTKLESKVLQDNKILYVSVNGLVCDFCARSIEKIFKRKQSVKSIDVNLEKMLITINLKEGENLTDETIKKLILDSGYEVVEVFREN
ncbi:MAG: hypothetical protein CMM91_09955 [Rickettsiales bacterium]|jgi:copper chaperone CopZ|nr:hypothetical protein [Rickettsiales bacterium]OUV52803.1 MAG: hypothetical protein CBC87_05440 [Rickettsiales bacterium TMED127]|tara:strand:- start:23903 stop:24214 length:312 start_codon:yes stop_codon:yes gene_type:complete